jgi:hypothetical protein
MIIRATAATTAVALAGAVRGAMISSSASVAVTDCTNYPESICLIDKGNWTGQVGRQYLAHIDGCRKLAPAGSNNKASSLRVVLL